MTKTDPDLFPAATPEGWFSDAASTFGDRVTGAREATGMTQRELADRLGVKLRTVTAWEDDMADPRANKLQMMAGMLGVSIRWLLTGEGDGPEGPAADAPGMAPAGAAKPVLAEMRQIRVEIGTLGDRLGRLEKRLRDLVTEDLE